MTGLILRTVRLVMIAGAVSVISFAQAGAAEPAAETEQLNSDTMASSAVVTDADLDSSRGAFLPNSLNINNVEQTAQSTGNVVIGGWTGSNVITGGSITNTQGLVNVIQNSGNNVLIQSSTVVNMTFNK